MPQSIAEQLAALTTAAPAGEFDPEDIDNDTGGDSGSEESADDTQATAHYVTVEKSKLRNDQIVLMDDERYVGRVASRRDIYAQHTNGMDLVDDDDDDEQQSEIHDGMESDEQDEQLEQQLAKMEQDEKALLNTLSKHAQLDMQKGYHVKNQLALWDAFLDARIRMQKMLINANQLPSHDTFAHHMQDDESMQPKLNETRQSLIQLINTLLDIQLELMSRNPEIQSSSTLDGSRKRVHDDMELDGIWTHINSICNGFTHYRDAAIDKWSSKAQMTSGAISQKKFKAINQGLQAQIHTILVDKQRLLKRTQLKRADYTIIDSSSSTDQYNEQIFDDTDFYQQLLRELISSRSAQSDDVLHNASQYATLRHLTASNKKKKPLDNKASKGRKLRYHPHEKLQNFMAPVPVGAWHDEMVAELYASLLGK